MYSNSILILLFCHRKEGGDFNFPAQALLSNITYREGLLEGSSKPVSGVVGSFIASNATTSCLDIKCLPLTLCPAH